jgi:glutamate formiminotransferase
MKLLIGYAGKEFLESGYIFAPYIPLQEASIFNINQLAANTKKLMNRKVIIKTYWDEDFLTEKQRNSLPSISDAGMSPRKRVMSV